MGRFDNFRCGGILNMKIFGRKGWVFFSKKVKWRNSDLPFRERLIPADVVIGVMAGNCFPESFNRKRRFHYTIDVCSIKSEYIDRTLFQIHVFCGWFIWVLSFLIFKDCFSLEVILNKVINWIFFNSKVTVWYQLEKLFVYEKYPIWYF